MFFKTLTSITEFISKLKYFIKHFSYDVNGVDGRLRAMLHNLPSHLNLGVEEGNYLFEVLVDFDRLHVPGVPKEISGNIHRRCGYNYSDRYGWDVIRERYLGKPIGGLETRLLSEDDFVKAGCISEYEQKRTDKSESLKKDQYGRSDMSELISRSLNASISLLEIAQCIMHNSIQQKRHQSNDFTHKVTPLNVEMVVFDVGTVTAEEKFAQERRRIVGEMMKNVVFHLNLDLEETKFLHYFFTLLGRIGEKKLIRECLIKNVDFSQIKSRYLNKHAGHARVDLLTDFDFILAQNGEASAIAKIANCILFKNIDRYQTRDEWFKPCSRKTEVQLQTQNIV